MKILLDTHIWLWLITGSSRLPEKLRLVLNDFQNDLWISPISIWEALLLSEKGRLQSDKDPVLRVRESLLLGHFKEAPLNFAVALKSREINLPHQDPADRFIVATAMVYNLNLATLDVHLKKLSSIKVIG